MADLFKELLSSVDSLNEEQVNTLLSRLNEKKAGQEQETSKLVRNLETGKIVACPYCGSVTIVKTGKKDGRQRYKCKDCKASFGDTTGTLHQHSKLTKDQWLGLIKGILLNISLRKIADDIGASVQTVWYNKQICTTPPWPTPSVTGSSTTPIPSRSRASPCASARASLSNPPHGGPGHHARGRHAPFPRKQCTIPAVVMHHHLRSSCTF